MNVKHIKSTLLALLALFAFGACSSSDDKLSDSLSIAEDKINFSADENLKKTVKVKTSNKEWGAKVADDGKEWCFVTSSINTGNIEIEVEENTNADKRSTTIVVQAGQLKANITVEQLGYSKDILVSHDFLTLKPISDNIEIIITSNTEYTISLPEWIVETTQETRAVEMVDKTHTFAVAANDNENKRVESIIITSQDETIKKEIVITQEGLENYDGSDTEGIKDDIKLKVESGEASSFQTNAEIEKSFDGDKNTTYHSSWSNKGENYFPITLTYNLAEDSEALDYLIYYPRQSGSNGLFKQVEILISTEETKEFTKLMDFDFKGSNTATKVQFEKAISKPRAVRFIVKSGAGDGQGFASCAEMEFYQKSPDTFDPLTLFTDETCTELKAGITEKEIDDCGYPFYKNIAFYLFNDKYNKEFRIQEYKAYPHPDQEAKYNKTNPYSLLDNPTGIAVKANEEIIIFAGDTHGENISVRIQNLDVPDGDGFGGPSFPITKGINKFTASEKGLLYVMYHTPKFKTSAPIKIHIATGSVNGYYDSQKHTKEDWNRLLNSATDRYFDVLGKYAHLTFPVDKFKKNTPDGLALINSFDDIVRLEMEFMGLFKYDKVFNNRMYLHVIYKAYMYATSYHTAYNVSTLDALCNVNNLRTGGVWGPAHEIGHVNQTRPGLLWAGTTEVTNNIHSLYVQTEFGNVSRIQGEDLGGGVNRYEKAISNMFVNNLAHVQEEDVFCKLVPFWQIQLYVSNVLGVKDVYKDIYEDVRNSPNLPKHGDNQLEFTYLASKAAGLDLTDFFTKWGFFKPVDVEVDDYGIKRLTVTKEQADNVINRIKALGLPKPGLALEYITDNTVELYKAASPVTNGKMTINGEKITMSGWNAAAYEVFIDNKLAHVSTNPTFTVNRALGKNFEVFAISPKGDRVKANL